MEQFALGIMCIGFVIGVLIIPLAGIIFVFDWFEEKLNCKHHYVSNFFGMCAEFFGVIAILLLCVGFSIMFVLIMIEAMQ